MRNDNLPLIYSANAQNKVAVKTPFGITPRENIPQIVLQGETIAPLLCSVQVDSFGKQCLKNGKYLYSYKGEVKIPPLAMIDDIISISQCGIDSVMVNSFLNSKTNLKKQYD